MKAWSHIPEIPVKKYPIFGHMPSLSGMDPHEYAKLTHKWFEDAKIDTNMLWIGHRPIVITRDKKVFDYILASNKHIKRSEEYWYMREWIGISLFTGTGDFWRRRRKLLTPAFHFQILEDFLPVMDSHGKDLVNAIEHYARIGKTVDSFRIMKLHTIAILCETAMGIECDIIGESFKAEWERDARSLEVLKFIKATDKFIDTLFIRNEKPWYGYKHLFLLFQIGREFYDSLSTIKGFVNNVIDERIKFLKENQGPSKNKEKKKEIFLDKVIAHYQEGGFNKEDVHNETAFFIFAGYDTTATALGWCLYLLGRNKDVQNKAYEEAKRIKEKGLTSSEAMKEMSYIQCVIKESLRLHPSLPFIPRDLEEDTVIDSVLYPKNTRIALCMYEMQRDPKVWKDPLTFKPERFFATDENAQSTKEQGRSFTSVPFSAGPRNCMGQRFAMMSMKVTLYHLLLKYEIVALQKEEEVQETIDGLNKIKDKNGLRISFKFRK